MMWEEPESKHESSSAPAPSARFLPQAQVPGLDESMSYQAPPPQLPATQPPQPSKALHGAHSLNSGPQPGTVPATQHSQVGPAIGQAYGPHTYTEPAKPKKGQQLWNRMKRKSQWAVERRRHGGWPCRTGRVACGWHSSLRVAQPPSNWVCLHWSSSPELGFCFWGVPDGG